MRRDRRSKGNPAVFLAFLHWSGLREDQEMGGIKWRDLCLGAGIPRLNSPERAAQGRSDVPLDAADPRPDAVAAYFTSDPAWAKNGKRQTVALNDECRTVMEAYRRTVPNGPDDPVFPIRPNRHTFQKLRDAAGIAAEDERGRGYSAHSARKWLATELDAVGASPGVVWAVLRHSDTLAEERYIQKSLSTQTLAVQGLALIWPENEGPGTEKVIAFRPFPDRLHQAQSGTNMGTVQSTSDTENRPDLTSRSGPIVPTNGPIAGRFFAPESDTTRDCPLPSPNRDGPTPQSDDQFERSALDAVRSLIALRAARLGLRAGDGGGGA
jgi:hypothetical protein